jgi:hypothetical protein
MRAITGLTYRWVGTAAVIMGEDACGFTYGFITRAYPLRLWVSLPMRTRAAVTGCSWG